MLEVVAHVIADGISYLQPPLKIISVARVRPYIEVDPALDDARITLPLAVPLPFVLCLWLTGGEGEALSLRVTIVTPDGQHRTEEPKETGIWPYWYDVYFSQLPLPALPFVGIGVYRVSVSNVGTEVLNAPLVVAWGKEQGQP